MSKTVKRKITVELPKPRDLSKNRLSVFQRLGTKKLKILESAKVNKLHLESITKSAVPLNTNSSSVVAATVNLLPVAAQTIKIIANKSEHVAFEDADPDILERKRAELKKELELQLKMETVSRKTKKEIVRKRKKVQRSSSSSSSSSTDSGSSSDSSSSSSSNTRRKIRKAKGGKRHNSSSSSDEPRLKKPIKAKKVCHKRLDASKLKVANTKKLLTTQAGVTKIRKRSLSPGSVAPIRKRTVAALPPSAKVGHKAAVKGGKLVVVESPAAKSHRLKEAAREKEREFQHREREREREREKERDRLRLRDKERPRSRSPKMRVKSRSPMKRLSRSRDIKHKSPPPPLRRPPSKTRSGAGSIRRERSLDRGLSGSGKKDIKRHDSRERERERRDRERDREAIREKERQEILARCQERQRERERIAREKTRKIEREREEERIKNDRLLPRPAERAMALAAARGRSREKSDDRDRPRSHSHHSHSHGGRERMERSEKDALLPAYDRSSGVGSGYLERDDLRYDPHRRIEKDDRSLLRDERDRDYVVVRRRDDSRDNHMNSPYHGREKRMPDRDDLLDRGDAYDHISGGVDHQRYDHMLRDDRRAAGSSGGVGGSGSVSGHDYGSSRGYINEHAHRPDRERDWIRDNDVVRDDRNVIFDRHPVRDWDRGDISNNHQSNNAVRDNYGDNRDWSNNMNDRQWDAGVGGGTGNSGNGGVNMSWQPEPEENWDNPDDKEWQDYHRNQQDKGHHDGNNDGNVGVNNGNAGIGNQMSGRGVGNRRWTNWRGRRGNQHHQSDFRRQQTQHNNSVNSHQDNFVDRSEQSYRRHQPIHGQTEQPMHCNTHGNADFVHNVTVARPLVITTPKLDILASPIKTPLLINDTIAPGTSEAKIDIITTTTAVSVEANESQSVVQTVPVVTVIKEAMIANVDMEGDEIIADDLSEISDDADEILNRQEEEMVATQKPLLPTPQLKELGGLLSTPIAQNWHHQQTRDRFRNYSTYDGTTDNYGNGKIFRPDYEPELQEKVNDFRPATTTDVENALLCTEDTDNVERQNPVDTSAIVASPLLELNESNNLPDEMDLAFEEISDGELEEEARIRGLGDALGVDWASLVEESKAIAKEKSLLVVKDTSAKQRWQPHRILLDVGVSFRMAGKEFASNVLNMAHRKLKEEQSAAIVASEISAKDENVTIKTEQTESSVVAGFEINEVKEEVEEELLIHPIACVQVASRVNAEHRRNLIFHATGPYSRALSARRDIEMRRQLCGLPIKDYNCGAASSSVGSRLDIGYASIARQLFEKALAKAN